MANQGFDDRNVIGIYRNEYQERFEGSWAQSVSLFNGNSNSASEFYGIFGAIGGLREWVGERQLQTISKKLYEVRNVPYEASLPIREIDLDRDKTGILSTYIGSFASEAAADHWEDLIAGLVNTNGNCYDGQTFFSTTHVWGNSGTQSNSVTASDVPALDVASTTNVTPYEMANVINGLAAQMLLVKNDKGRYVNGQARQFTIAVSTPQLYSAAVSALTQTVMQGIVDNPMAGFKNVGFDYKVKLIPSLTNAAAKVRLFRTDAKLKPFILQEEKPLETSLLGRDSDHFFKNKEIVLGVDGRRGAGYGLWEYAIEGTLS